jgi:hypothetical protein
MAFNFSNMLGSAGIGFQKTAFNIFGAAVDQFSNDAMSNVFSGANQAMGDMFGGGGFGGNSGDTISDFGGHEWNTTAYARDLIRYQPKHRFLFKVLFETYDGQAFNHLFGDNRNAFQYVIKHIDKPTITFNYEDVNYYNYKSKVLKTITHDALSMTMIDDIDNSFHDFFRGYLLSHSPISRSYNSSQSIEQLKTNGFAFSNLETGGSDSAIRGVLENGNEHILKSIRVFQYFAHGMMVNEFRFVNPRIIDFNFDEASHEGGDQGHHCTIRFDYDALVLEPTKQLSGSPEYRAPMTDLYVNGDDGGMGIIGGVADPILGMVRGAAGRYGSSVLQGMSNSVLSGISSGNPILQGVTQKISYGIGTVGRNTIYGMSGGSPGIYSSNSIMIRDEYK